MEPALKNGRFVLGLRSHKIRKGDFVIAQFKGKEVIKLIRDINDEKVFLSGNRPKHDVGWIKRLDVKGRIVWPRR
jgi:phage repressor protein C with HTH and peptisase S24 domain